MTFLRRSVCLSAFIGLAAATVANATIDSAVLNLRVFNDDPGSSLTTVNNYPALVEISDTRFSSVGFANLHNFHLADAGVEHAFANNEAFSFSADLTISGGGNGAAGLQLAPWWSQNVDGRFNFRTTDGEIAVFGGRLPFYSFTGSQGLTYSKGDTVRVGMVYDPNSLSSGDPATITYNLTQGGNDYTSGPLAFDEGNPAESYGSWGHLDDARLGGYTQVFAPPSSLVPLENDFTVQWSNMSYVVPEPSSIAMIGLVSGCAVFIRRRFLI